MNDLDAIFSALLKSSFRRKFHLGSKDRSYLLDKGMPLILEHAAHFVAKRLAPAEPANDGKQTPYRGHPVFVAQHATATCCRSCLMKWHGIEIGQSLTAAQQIHAVAAIERWLRNDLSEHTS